MYFSFGFETIISNSIALGAAFSAEKPIRSLDELRMAYHQFLSKQQPDVPIPQCSGTSFIKDVHTAATLSRFYRVTSRLDDRAQTSHISTPDSRFIENTQRVEAEFKKFAEAYPEIGTIFNTLIHSVFCSPSKTAGGGSTSGAIGVIWCGVRDTWATNDFFEFFVHELTHNLVFIDEHKHLHYKDYRYLSDPEYFAWSAILGMNRPLDKVLHSLAVATEVLLFREMHIGHPSAPRLHPPSQIMLKKAKASVESIRSNPKTLGCLTPRGNELLRRCEDKLGRLEQSLISQPKDSYASPVIQNCPSIPVAV